MKRIISMVLSWVLLLNVGFGYTLTINTENGTTTRELEAGKIVTVGLSDRSPARYKVDTENTLLQLFGNRRRLVMQDEPVEVSIMKYHTVTFQTNGGSAVEPIKVALGFEYGELPVSEKENCVMTGWYLDEACTTLIESTTLVETTGNHILYAGWRPLTPLVDVVEVGDYVTYYPNKTSYTIETTDAGTDLAQIFNPSLITSWRVFKNDGSNVELISADSTTTLVLGSEQSGDTSLNAYKKAVKTLAEYSEAFVNPDYAVEGSGRALGSTESSVSEIADSTTTDFSTDMTVSPYTDTEYTSDVNILTESAMHLTNNVWLGSRYVEGTSSNRRKNFAMRYLDSSGELAGTGVFYRYSDDGARERSSQATARPILKLQQGICTDTLLGDGSPERPYLLGVPKTVNITFNTDGGSDVDKKSVIYDANYGELPITTKEGYCFGGWYLDKECTNRITEDSIVETATNHTLYVKWITTTAEMPEGSYIIYQPSETSYTVTASRARVESDQTFNPSETIRWRVLRNDGTTLEIISENSIGDLSLGNSDADTSRISYQAATRTLNELSNAYINSEYAVLESGRGLGSTASSVLYFNGTDYPETWTQTYHSANLGEPYGDVQYIADLNQLRCLGISPNTSIWLASRRLATTGTSSTFSVRYLTNKNLVTSYILYTHYADSNTTAEGAVVTKGVMPIVALKTDILLTGGSGTEDAPYEIGGNIIVATAGSHGTISPSGNVSVLSGKNKTFTITPNLGYEPEVFVDGVNMGAITSYTFENITESHTIDVTFNSLLPDFTYTGNYTTSVDNTYWYINLKTDGTLTFNNATATADAFLVGGGGGGANGGSNYGGGGGGGGYTTTISATSFTQSEDYTVDIGDGGSAGSAGKATSITDSAATTIATVSGGEAGSGKNGGNGGSGGGGGGGSDGASSQGGNGGTNGANGSAGKNASGNSSSGGTGQGTSVTTKAFGTGTVYAGGGGGGGGQNSSAGSGGTNGANGGNGNYCSNGSNGSDASSNTGGGGGGGGTGDFDAYDNAMTPGNGGKGGSGIVILRIAY